MKIEFESRDEIRKLTDALQNGIYPAPIIISAEELLEASNGNMQLPWGSDGFHLPIAIKGEEESNKADLSFNALLLSRDPAIAIYHVFVPLSVLIVRLYWHI